MNNILDGLGVSFSPVESAPEPAPIPALAERPGFEKTPAKPLLLLKSISEGDLPGVYVPPNAPKIPSSLTPDDIAGVGVGLYLPHDPSAALVLFNKQKVSLGDVQRIDQEGKLTSTFPSVTEVLGELPGAAGNPEAPVEESTPETVPVLPRNNFPGSVAANARLKNLNGQSPSQRPIPGGGEVLNGLLKRPV